MAPLTKGIKTMEDLCAHTLRDNYYAENKIVQSLPEMIENATNEQLKTVRRQEREHTDRTDASMPYPS